MTIRNCEASSVVSLCWLSAPPAAKSSRPRKIGRKVFTYSGSAANQSMNRMIAIAFLFLCVLCTDSRTSLFSVHVPAEVLGSVHPRTGGRVRTGTEILSANQKRGATQMKKTFLAVAAAAILLPPLAKVEPPAITKDDVCEHLAVKSTYPIGLRECHSPFTPHCKQLLYGWLSAR